MEVRKSSSSFSDASRISSESFSDEGVSVEKKHGAPNKLANLLGCPIEVVQNAQNAFGKGHFSAEGKINAESAPAWTQEDLEAIAASEEYFRAKKNEATEIQKLEKNLPGIKKLRSECDGYRVIHSSNSKLLEALIKLSSAADQAIDSCNEAIKAMRTKEETLAELSAKAKESSCAYVDKFNKDKDSLLSLFSVDDPVVIKERKLAEIMNKLSCDAKLMPEEEELRESLAPLLALRKKANDDFNELTIKSNQMTPQASLWQKAAEASCEYLSFSLKVTKEIKRTQTEAVAPELAQKAEHSCIIAECRVGAAKATKAGKKDEALLWSAADQAWEQADNARGQVGSHGGGADFFLKRFIQSSENLARSKMEQARSMIATRKAASQEPSGADSTQEKKSSRWFSFFGRRVTQVPSSRPSYQQLAGEESSEKNPAEEKAAQENTSIMSSFYKNVSAAMNHFTSLGLFRHFVKSPKSTNSSLNPNERC